MGRKSITVFVNDRNMTETVQNRTTQAGGVRESKKTQMSWRRKERTGTSIKQLAYSSHVQTIFTYK